MISTDFSIDPATLISKVIAFHAGQQTRQGNLSLRSRRRRRTSSEHSRYLTPAQVAAELNISVKTVIRRFENHPGVVNLGSERKPRRKGKREKYAILRIPREALAEFISESRVR
jgi:hypothetical protein